MHELWQVSEYCGLANFQAQHCFQGSLNWRAPRQWTPSLQVCLPTADTQPVDLSAPKAPSGSTVHRPAPTHQLPFGIHRTVWH